MKQFGTKTENINYTDRPGVYAVMIDSDCTLIAIEYRGKYFLPGGGCEAGESFEETIHREVLEEIGYKVEIISKFGVAADYVDIPAENLYINKINHFYKCELLSQVNENSERDHSRVRLIINEFISNATHESHAWVLSQVL